MARRNRPRVVWLPGTNANSFGVANTSTTQFFIVSLAAPAAAGDVAVGEIPLIIDSQDDPLDPVTSLSDVENSGYRLRRVVGKIWCDFVQEDDNDIADSVIVTAGLIVRRSLPTTGISYAVNTGDDNLISPQHIGNQGDPWIWRRSWKLWQNFQGPLAFGQVGPPNNYTHVGGGNADGAHVDQKTARVISSEERLFLDVSVLAAQAGGGGGTVNVFADLRCLASMRTTTGNRNNASR